MVKFNPDTDIPDLTGKVILVTGGTDGLGKEAVLQFSKHNPAHIYLAARSKSKAETCIAEIKSKSPNACPITFLEIDLSSFASIKAAAQTFKSSNPRLDILMCNAGIIGVTGVTKEGYETTFGVNHVGHALFIKLMMPTLLETAKTNPEADVRLVILGSDAESFAPKKYYLLTPEEIKSPLSAYGTFSKYGHSKIANIHYTQKLAELYPEDQTRVKIVCVHPGAVSTNLGSDIMAGWPRVQSVMRKVMAVVIRMVPVEEGTKNQLWASVAKDVKHGEFYHPIGLAGKGSARTKDKAKAQELWDWTEKELEGHA